jgi:hypothetical protein
MTVVDVLAFNSWVAMEPTPPGAADDQNAVDVGRQRVALAEDRFPASKRADRKRRGIDERELVRDAGHNAVVDGQPFGPAAIACDIPVPVTRSPRLKPLVAGPA